MKTNKSLQPFFHCTLTLFAYSLCDRSTQSELFTLEICISLSDSDQNNQSELVRTLTASLLLRQICRIIFVCTKKYKVDQKEITKLCISIKMFRTIHIGRYIKCALLVTVNEATLSKFQSTWCRPRQNCTL